MTKSRLFIIKVKFIRKVTKPNKSNEFSSALTSCKCIIRIVGIAVVKTFTVWTQFTLTMFDVCWNGLNAEMTLAQQVWWAWKENQHFAGLSSILNWDTPQLTLPSPSQSSRSLCNQKTDRHFQRMIIPIYIKCLLYDGLSFLQGFFINQN